jgi:hypothetical protein
VTPLQLQIGPLQGFEITHGSPPLGAGGTQGHDPNQPSRSPTLSGMMSALTGTASTLDITKLGVGPKRNLRAPQDPQSPRVGCKCKKAPFYRGFFDFLTECDG